VTVNAEAFALEVARRHGPPPDAATSLVGRGAVNHVVIVRTGVNRVVVRFPVDPLRDDEYEVEAWALTQAVAHGIPSPTPIAMGRHQGVRYIVQTFVEGMPGADVETPGLWRTLGQYAGIIHRIPIPDDAPAGLFTRFGRDPALAWERHLDYNLDQLDGEDPLIELGVYPLAQQAPIRDVLSQLTTTRLAFGLAHGDLSPRNLLVPNSGPPVLIDWGSSSVGPVPFGDVQPLRRSRPGGAGPTGPGAALLRRGTRHSLRRDRAHPGRIRSATRPRPRQVGHRPTT